VSFEWNIPCEEEFMGSVPLLGVYSKMTVTQEWSGGEGSREY
jgi:hypothetical protein